MRWTEKIVGIAEFVGFEKKKFAETEGYVGLVKHFEQQQRSWVWVGLFYRGRVCVLARFDWRRREELRFFILTYVWCGH